ncbi:MAG TPA: RimK family alpha-L-glutamate ligase [Candidatus Nanoarchaeia archaeon]|nr:RimK family alpha-L-glutamate ligase [Candidatus Nanoarchaeia archaeon]
MKAALISLGSESSKMTAEAMKKYFSQVDHLSLKHIEVHFSGSKAEVLYEGKPLGDYDCIYAKGSFRYASILQALTHLRYDQCYMPLREEAFSIAHDKFLTQLAFLRNHIPMPKTYLAATVEAAREILKNISYPIIMKFPQGTQGKGVMVADTFASASSILDALTALKQPFIIQEFIDTEDEKSGGTHIRGLVIGDRVAGSVRYRSGGSEKRSNWHLGGKVEPILMDPSIEQLAIKASKASGAEISAVDMLESPKGPFIIEVNISPGLGGISKVTKSDLPNVLAKFLSQRTQERLDHLKQKDTQKLLKTIDSKSPQEFISNLDFRGARILLPEIVTKLTRFRPEDEYEVKAQPGKLEIKQFKL